MQAYLWLFIAILCEVVATTSLKASEGFTRLVPSLLVVVGYIASFYLLSIALKQIALGTAYAIWSGLGIVGTMVAGLLIWHEQVTVARALGALLIVAGVIVLQLFSNPHGGTS